MIMDIINENETVTPNSHEIEILKEHFPSCFQKDGSFDLVRFQEFLSDKIVVTNEGYELRFLGKNYARLLASLDTTTVIVPDEEHNGKPENVNSENVYISGDNLDGLKHLLKSYAGMVKCIYIDPPYNTGTDGFVYNDKFEFTKEELSKKLSISDTEAERILNLTKKNRASHSAWLIFMYPRLLLARDLLTDDGVIFIAIDDNEYAQLKMLCDDVFGEENFISSMVWSAGRKNDSTFMSNSHEYMLAYFRNKSNMLERKVTWRTRKGGLDDIYAFYNALKRKYGEDYCTMQQKLREWYANLDDSAEAKRHSHYKCIDATGIYFPSDISWPGGGGPKYEVLHPITRKPCKVPERGWVYPTKERMLEVISQGLVHFGDDETTVPCNKTYLKDNEYEVPYSVFYKDGRAATKRLKALLGEGVFTNPKDEDVLAQIFAYSTDRDSIVLDFFSGSATTAHAVFMSNILSSHGTRKFIAIQLPEDIDMKYQAATEVDKKKIKKSLDFLDSVNCPHTLDYIGFERIMRVANQIRANHPSATIDLGFRHYTLAEPTSVALEQIEKFTPDANGMFENNIWNEFGTPTILATWLVRDGYGLTSTAQCLDFDGYTAYYIGKHLYLIAPGLSEKAIMAIVEKIETDGKFNPEHIVLLGYSFKWSEMEQLKINLQRMNATERSYRAKFDIRY